MLVTVLVRFLLTSALLLSAAAASAESVYVAPEGNGDGRTPRTAMALNPSNAKAIAGRAVNSVYLMPGTYRLAAPVRVLGSERGVTWQAYRPGSAVLDGLGRASAGIIVNGDNVIIRDLVLRNFTDDGIRLINTRDARILGNTITNITSSTWSRGAIHGGNSASGTIVARNHIAHTGYSGIIFDTSPDGDLSNISIKENTVLDTCRTQKDCGAIYINGRTPRSQGTIIEKNTIRDFGPAENETKGIYLDDWLSSASVRSNSISGTGTYAFQIHGGSHNTISGNQINVLGSFLLYQSNDTNGFRQMTNNYIIRNYTNTVATRALGKLVTAPDLSENIRR